MLRSRFLISILIVVLSIIWTSTLVIYVWAFNYLLIVLLLLISTLYQIMFDFLYSQRSYRPIALSWDIYISNVLRCCCPRLFLIITNMFLLIIRCLQCRCWIWLNQVRRSYHNSMNTFNQISLLWLASHYTCSVLLLALDSIYFLLHFKYICKILNLFTSCYTLVLIQIMNVLRALFSFQFSSWN